MYGPHLKEFYAHDPALHTAAETAYKEMEGVGFQNAGAQRTSVEIFKRHWLAYCRDHLPKNIDGQILIHCLEQSAIMPMIDFVRNRPAEEIIELLKRYGLDEPAQT